MLTSIYNIFHSHYHARYHLKYRHAKKLFVFDMFLLATAIMLLGISIFLFLWKPGVMDKVDLKIEMGQNRILSGDEVCFNVSYKNRNEIKLKNPILGIELPDGFVPDEKASQTQNTITKHPLIKLDDLEPGETGNASVCGQLWVEPLKDYNITASLTYQPDDAEFKEQKNSSLILNLPDSIIKSDLSLVNRALPQSQLVVAFTIQNNSDKRINNLNIGSEPEILFKENVKNIILEANEKKILNGIVITPATNNNFTLRTFGSVLVNNFEIKQTEAQKTVEIYAPNFSLQARFPADIKYSEPGQTLPLEISLQNNSSASLNDLEIELTANPQIVNLTETAKNNNLKIKNNRLIINSKNRTALGSLEAGAQDKFFINLKLNSQFNLQKLENANLEITPILIIKSPESLETNFSKAGNPAVLPIATELKMTVEPRYYTDEGDQLGVGPLPPKAGETTKYWIFTRIFNSTSAVKDAKFLAELPNGVEFTGKQSVTIGSPLTLSQDKKTLNWNFSKLPPNSVSGLYFEVAINPTPEQIGKPIELLKNIKFTATDDRTGKLFSLTKNTINDTLK